MGAVTQSFSTPCLNGCQPYILDLPTTDKTTKPNGHEESQAELDQLLIKIKRLSLDIWQKQVEFEQLKNSYDPNSKNLVKVSTLLDKLNENIKRYYNDFSKRRFEILEKFGSGSYSLEQQIKYWNNLEEMDERFKFFDNVTVLIGQVKKHESKLPRCIIL